MKENDGRRRDKKNPSQDFIAMICDIYADSYDDREEDSSPGGADWVPGERANHTSLAAFKKELEGYGYTLSTAKIRKILITGGCWTTERSREVAELYQKYGTVAKVAKRLGVTEALRLPLKIRKESLQGTPLTTASSISGSTQTRASAGQRTSAQLSREWFLKQRKDTLMRFLW